jgi:hypothetical protein
MMATGHDIQSMLSRLEALLSSGVLTQAETVSCSGLAEALRRPARVAILGQSARDVTGVLGAMLGRRSCHRAAGRTCDGASPWRGRKAHCDLRRRQFAQPGWLPERQPHAPCAPVPPDRGAASDAGDDVLSRARAGRGPRKLCARPALGGEAVRDRHSLRRRVRRSRGRALGRSARPAEEPLLPRDDGRPRSGLGPRARSFRRRRARTGPVGILAAPDRPEEAARDRHFGCAAGGHRRRGAVSAPVPGGRPVGASEQRLRRSPVVRGRARGGAGARRQGRAAGCAHCGRVATPGGR